MKCFVCRTDIVEMLSFHNLFERPHLLCERCRIHMAECMLDSTNRCPYCKGCLTDEQCMTCAHLSDCPVRFNQIFAPFCYANFMKELIQQYKFMKDVALAEVIARYMIWPQLTYDWIIPIPSSPSNDQARTFNPVKYVLTARGIAFQDILTMPNRHKQFDLTKKERFRISNEIHVSDGINLENKSILLVDDIYTTGKTAHNAAIKLFQSKVRKLDMLTFAR
ncbi:hypothetical protein TP70_00925 [Staphylococcus microti]|uniref:Competence protein ComF n=4 Tax=Staphylococcus microti TaxID=569857 RepID=A0ABR5CAT5_9STAP|nr:hypothetical protein TP70_00925 [Staphylococcus microti]